MAVKSFIVTVRLNKRKNIKLEKPLHFKARLLALPTNVGLSVLLSMTKVYKLQYSASITDVKRFKVQALIRVNKRQRKSIKKGTPH